MGKLRYDAIKSPARRKSDSLQIRSAANLLRIRRRVALGHRHGTTFPPRPRGKQIAHRIISRFCKATHPVQFIEVGCAVCQILN
ncbi:hypothetical protein C8J57DRAFT_1086923 [Mycena rebaudengoi]|nr:hypothetical protein C8J57DRAFT_1086923 [Mycena rebaudengoi]